MNRELMAGVAAAVTLAGVWLCWRAPAHRISIEERAKDGLLSAEEGRRRIRRLGWMGPTMAALGCGLLVAAIWW